MAGSARPGASTEASAQQMSSVTGELQGKLDSKTARAGEEVVLKTTEKVRTADGTVIPKGTRLIGHVTEAQAHNSAHAESQLGVTFDRAELKDGQSFAIRSTIDSIEPRPNYAAQSSMADDNMFASPMGGGMVGGRAMGGGRIGGGGLMGGAVERTGFEATRGSERIGSSAEGTAGSAVAATGRSSAHLARGMSSRSAATLHAAGASGAASAASSNRFAARATGVPGVMLRNSASGAASGTLSATNRNVHLDSGTQMDLSFAAAGGK